MNLVRVCSKVVVYPREDLLEQLSWEIGAREDGHLLGCEKDGQGPAARGSRHQLMGRLVNLVEIRAFFPVHLDIHEQRVHQLGRRLVFERLMCHDMAPVACGIADGEQDGFVLISSQLQRFFIPGEPIYRVVRVLQEIRTRFVMELVGHDSTIPVTLAGPGASPRLN